MKIIKGNLKNLLKFFILVFVFIITISFAFALTGCVEKTVEVEKITLSKNVDINGNPTEESNSFKEGTKEIFLVTKVKNMKPTDNLTVKWVYLDKNLEINSKTFIPNKEFSGNHVFRIKIAQGFPFGDYEVSVFLNGTQLKTLPFKVN